MAQRLLILCLTLLASVAHAATPSPLFPHEGKPIIIIRVEGGDDSADQIVRSLLEIEPGYIFSSLEVSRAVRRLYSLGRFRDTTVRVNPMGDALELVVSVTEQQRVGEVIVEGDDDLEVRRELRSSLAPGQPYDPALLELLEKKCQRSWELVGYFQAVCTAESRPSTKRKNRFDIHVSSKKNEPSKITSIVFGGSERPPDHHLLKEIEERVGERLVDKTLRADERALKLAYFKRGFLTASVKAEALRTENNVLVRFEVTSGPRVSLKILGNIRFKDSALLDLVRRQQDEPLGRETLDAWRRAVISKYQSRGFAFAEATVKSYYESSRGIVHHVLDIKEGERAAIEKLSFPGAVHFSEERLREETTAFVSERMDATAISGDVNVNAVRSLEADSKVGISQNPRIVPPRFDHWLFRDDPSKLLLHDAYRQALEAIRKLYLEQGYTRVEVGPVTVVRKPMPSLPQHIYSPAVPERTELEVTIPVKEGPRTTVSVLSFGGTQALSSESLLDLAKIGPGEPFSELLVEETRNAMQKALSSRGYLYARIESNISFSPDYTRADIRYNITDGPQVSVGRVLIQGNETTVDAVIGDRIALEQEKPYSPELAQSTKDELLKLETFGSVQVGLSDPEVPADQKDVMVNLVERDTFRSIDAGIGFSTTQGVRGYVEYTDKNLFNRAHQLLARLQLNRQFAFAPIFYNKWAEDMARRYGADPAYGGFSRDALAVLFESVERLVRLSWRTPRTLKLPALPQLYAELVNERINTIPFSLDSFTFLIGVDLIPVNHLGLVLESSIAYNGLQCFSLQGDTTTAPTPDPNNPTPAPSGNNCDPQNLGRVTQVVQGAFFNWKAGPTLLVDFRDDKLNPRAGFLGTVKADAVLGTQLARPNEVLTGDPRYGFLKAEISLTGYIPVGKRASFVLSATAGNIFRLYGEDSRVRAQLNERYYIGGRNTLRGYPDRSVIPEDACITPVADGSNCIVYNPNNPNQAPPVVPGAFKFVAKAEFRFPVISDLMAGVFVDAGNLYFDVANFQPLNLRWNFGAGIRYQTGVGAIAIDIGLNPFFRPERGESVFAYPYIYFGLF